MLNVRAECDTAAGNQDSEAETNVRITAGAVGAANIQYGERCADYGEYAEYNGNCGRITSIEQGDQEAVRKD